MNIPTTSEVIAKLKAGTIPAAAMFMPGDIAVLVGKESDAKTVKVHLKARSKDPINHWYFGKVVHDFGSARIPSKVALDDTHGDIPIGHGRPSLTEYGLEVDGVITPDAENAQHPANMMAHAMRSDIPMQASIDFSGDYDVMEVPEGASIPINGKPFAGPGCVIMNWGLRAMAICKAGADPSTETTQMSQGTKMAQAPKTITQFSNSTAGELPSTTPKQNAQGDTAPPAGTILAETVNPVVDTEPTKQAEAPKAVEAPPVVEPPKPQLTQEQTESAEQLTLKDAEIQALQTRINALSKPAVAPIAGVSQEKPKMNEPTTWTAALEQTKTENPYSDPASILRLAAKKYPTLNKVGWRSPEATARYGPAKEI